LSVASFVLSGFTLNTLLSHFHDLLQLLVCDGLVATIQSLLFKQDFNFFFELLKSLTLFENDILVEEFLTLGKHLLNFILDCRADLDLVDKKIHDFINFEVRHLHRTSNAFACKLELTGLRLNSIAYLSQLHDRVVHLQSVPELELLLQLLLRLLNNDFAVSRILVERHQQIVPTFSLGAHHIRVITQCQQELLERVAL